MRHGPTLTTQNRNKQSMEWRCPSSPRPQKFKTRARRSLLQFLDNLGVILIDFLEEGCTINSDRYIAILRKLKEAIRRKRPELNVHDIKLHHDNARPHTFFVTIAAIARMGWSVVPHPPYSPWPRSVRLSSFLIHEGQSSWGEIRRPRWSQECNQNVVEAAWHGIFPKWIFVLAKTVRKCIDRRGDYMYTEGWFLALNASSNCLKQLTCQYLS